MPVAQTITDAKGRIHKRHPYPLLMTPYDKPKSLPLAEQFLKKGINFEQLEEQTYALSDRQVGARVSFASAIVSS